MMPLDEIKHPHRLVAKRRVCLRPAPGPFRLFVPSVLLAAALLGTGIRAVSAQDGSASALDANPSRSEAFRITGWVHDSSDKPIADAMVRAQPLFESGAEQCAIDTTDSQGAFVLRFSPSVDRQKVTHVWAYARGHGLIAVDCRSGAADSGSDIVIRLPAKEATSFRVFTPHKEPLAGALVYPIYVNAPRGAFGSSRPSGPIMPIPEPFQDVLSQRTDGNGVASFEAVPKALMASFAVESLSYGVQRFVKTDSDLILEKAGTLGGQIVGKDLARYAGVDVVIESSQLFGQGGYAATKLNERGTFRVPAIAAGRLRLRLNWEPDSDVHPVGDSEVTLQPETALFLKIQTRPTVSVSGVVATEDTRVPVAGAKLGFNHPGHPSLFSNIATTDESGRYTAKVVAGEVHCQLYAWGSRDNGLYERYDYPGVVKHLIAENGEVEQLPDILLRPMRVVAGTIEDTEGKPLASRVIGLVNQLHPHIYSKAESLADGSFEMRVSSRLTANVPQIQNSLYWAIVENPATGPRPPVLTKLKVLYKDAGAVRLQLPNVAAGPTGTANR